MILDDARPLVIINSGAYAHQELSAEFGALPPAFLPIGLNRLYELQSRMFAASGCELILTLPESFEVPVWDANRLQELGFTVLRTADDLPLGEALLQALGQTGFADRPLRLLHGDTLLTGFDPARDDTVAVADGRDGYRWAVVASDAKGRVTGVSRPTLVRDDSHGELLCGYYALASARTFAAQLALARGDFHAGLQAYAVAHGLTTFSADRWLDFGHVQTFFNSRRVVATARAFNTLQIGESRVRKRSFSASGKLRAEARWLREAPPTLAPFCARLLDEGEDDEGYFYDTEYEYMPTLAELYVFGALSPSSWARVLASCVDFMERSSQSGRGAVIDGHLHGLVVNKTRERMERFSRNDGFDLDAPNMLNGRPAPSLNACLEDISSVLENCGDEPAVLHGDFCFSNILYNFRTNRIRLIDPRGQTETGEFSLLGDMRYDLAKLMHSLCGRYDLIVAGRFSGGRVGAHAFEFALAPEDWRVKLEETAKSLVVGGVRLDSEVVWAAMTSLFLSMVPLHADRPDRQHAFLANALRLHLSLGGERA